MGKQSKAKYRRKSSHIKGLLCNQWDCRCLDLWEPVCNTSVIPPEGQGSSGLYATNLCGHRFWTAPDGIDFEHCWTAVCGLWSQRKPSAKRCRFLQWNMGQPSNERPEGIWAWGGKLSASAVVSIKRHKSSNVLWASNLHLTIKETELNTEKDVQKYFSALYVIAQIGNNNNSQHLLCICRVPGSPKCLTNKLNF